MTNPNEESTQPKDPAETPSNELNKPIGEAIQTPVEPGLDQPLPEKPKKDVQITSLLKRSEMCNGEINRFGSRIKVS